MVSVIIVDYKKDNPLLIKCLDAVEKQTYRNFEIILLTDYKNNLKYPKLRKKSYGIYVGPAQKRDDGAKMARGEMLVFIDDDAYPCEDWLANIIKDFNDPQIAAVGGPGVTPCNSSWKEQASGWFSASPLGGGTCTHRFIPGHKKFVDDYPTMNLAVLKKDFLDAGGFDSHFWPGEDTKLCHDVFYKLRKKIIYDPKVIVYHHRRPLWAAHLIQNGNYGLHRGYFARVLPKTSFRFSYFCPSILVFGLLFLFPVVFPVYGVLLIVNAIWIIKKSRSVFQGLVSIPVVFLTHTWYGIKFLQGFLFTKRLER